MDGSNELAVLERAGIEPAGSNAFTEWLTQMAGRAAGQLEQTPVVTEIRDAEGYRYVKSALSAYRKVKKEAEDGRKVITSQLDEAKRACMDFTAESIAPIEEAIASMSALQRGYEDEGRAAKRSRLEAYWERAYPALALCAGESEDPLVPFSRVFDPDWTRRVGELGSDVKARASMDAIAAKLADGERAIDALDEPEDLKVSAKIQLFATLDPVAALHGVGVEKRRRRDIERMQAAQADSIADLRADSPSPAPEGPKAPIRDESAPRGAEGAGPRHEIAVSIPCEAMSRTVVVVWADGDDERKRAVEAMRGAGLHGAVGRVI